MLPSGSAEDFGIFAGTAAEIAALPTVPRKPHEAKRIMPYQALCAAADRHGWEVQLVHVIDVVDPMDRDIPVWILRVIRNPSGDRAHWQVQYAESRNPNLAKALPLMAAACIGKVRAWS